MNSSVSAASEDPSPRASSTDRSPRASSSGRPDLARARRRSWWLVYFMLVYGVALIVLTLALWYLFVAPGGTAPSPTPANCAIGPLPASATSNQATLAARPTAFPPPSNGSGSLQSFELWVNTSRSLLPGTNVSFQVRSMPGLTGGASCTLPIPSAGWQANTSSVTLYPGQGYLVSFTGAPQVPYPRAGGFAAETWVNATNTALRLGSTPVYLDVV